MGLETRHVRLAGEIGNCVLVVKDSVAAIVNRDLAFDISEGSSRDKSQILLRRCQSGADRRCTRTTLSEGGSRREREGTYFLELVFLDAADLPAVAFVMVESELNLGLVVEWAPGDSLLGGVVEDVESFPVDTVELGGRDEVKVLVEELSLDQLFPLRGGRLHRM